MSIVLTKNAENQHQSKYINIQYYYIRMFINKKNSLSNRSQD